MPCCGKFPALQDRVRLMAEDEIDRTYCACLGKWCKLPLIGGVTLIQSNQNTFLFKL